MTPNRRFAALSVAEAKRRIDAGNAILVDIRDPHEHSSQHIAGARLVPLGEIDAHDFDRDRAAGKAVIFHCQSGRRTEVNAARLAATGFNEVYVLEGGLNAWRAAGLPVSAA